MLPRRGGANRGGQLHGQTLPFGDDPEIEEAVQNIKCSDLLYPDFEPPYAEPPTTREKSVVAFMLRVRKAHRSGPMFANLDMVPHVNKHGKREANPATYDAFDDPTTFANKHAKPNKLLDLAKAPGMHPELLAKELRDVVDPNAHGVNVKKETTKAPTGKSALQMLLDDDEGASSTASDEEKSDEREVDDAFDEDDESDDYNAEKYFDGGDDDEAGGEEAD